MRFATLPRPALRAIALFLVLCCLPFSALAETPDQVRGEGVQNEGSAQKPDPRIPALLAQLDQVRSFRQTALSPDGKQIAWVLDTSKGTTAIELASLADPSSTRAITAASANQAEACNEEDIAWSPDGKQLAFLSDCASPEQAQIFVVNAQTREHARKASNLHGFVESLQWSPDGKALSFLYVAGATRRAGALDAMKPPSGVIGEDGIEIQRVAAVNPSSGELRFLTPANLHVYEFDWSPDARQLAYVAAAPPGENNWWVAQLYTQDVSSGRESTSEPLPPPRSILDPNRASSPLHGLQVAVPRWSPDGKSIALIGGLMSDQGSTGGDIYVLPASGGDPVDFTPGSKETTGWIRWIGNDQVGASQIRNGEVIYRNIPATSMYNGPLSTELLRLPASIGDGRLELSLSFSNSGEVAFIRSSWSEAPEVWVGKSGHIRQITHVNDALKPAWGKAESVIWTSEAATGKFTVQGWLLYPAKYDPAKKYPMIAFVHGGPASATLPHWPGAGFNGAAFSALGYFVLFPNPRGSFGQGEAFIAANRKDFGYGDLHDIVTGVDAVTARYPVDGTRVGLTGWSYGGFMTMFAVTQTNRFRAAVAGAGLSNWQSYYGQNSIDQWMIPYFGASVYDDPAVYAKSSAINFIHNVKTPTLIVVGDRDGECPAPQSYEFWHALRAQHVPARLVVYPNEGHRFVSADHRRDVLQRSLEWFQQYMPAQP